MPSDPLTAALEVAVSSDDMLKVRATRLANSIFSEAEAMIATGSPAVKVQLVKSMLPAIVKAMASEEKVDDQAELRAAFIELQAEVRAGFYQRPDHVDEQAEAPVDTPKVPVKKPRKPRPRAT